MHTTNLRLTWNYNLILVKYELIYNCRAAVRGTIIRYILRQSCQSIDVYLFTRNPNPEKRSTKKYVARHKSNAKEFWIYLFRGVTFDGQYELIFNYYLLLVLKLNGLSILMHDAKDEKWTRSTLKCFPAFMNVIRTTTYEDGRMFRLTTAKRICEKWTTLQVSINCVNQP